MQRVCLIAVSVSEYTPKRAQKLPTKKCTKEHGVFIYFPTRVSGPRVNHVNHGYLAKSLAPPSPNTHTFDPEKCQETLRAMQRLVDIFRRATASPSAAKNPLTAGAAERREWQYEDTSNEPQVLLGNTCNVSGVDFGWRMGGA